LKRTYILILLAVFLFAERITIVRDNVNYAPLRPPETNLTMVLSAEMALKAALIQNLEGLSDTDADELLNRRYQRFRVLGEFA